LRVVNDEYRIHHSKRYVLELEDQEGRLHQISALAIKSITSMPQGRDLSGLAPILAHYPKEIQDRPSGEVDLLLGLESRALHPWATERLGNLRVSSTIFGCGWVVSGTSPGVIPHVQTQARSVELDIMSHASVTQPVHCTVSCLDSREVQGGFPDLEELSCAPPPVCSSCTGCR
jgi:hypothetical protein